MRRRIGRPGLVGTMARTAVVAGTATAVSGRVQQNQQARASATVARQQAEQQAALESQAQLADMQAQLNDMRASTSPPPAQGGDDMIAKLQQLADMKAQGLLSDDEFAAAKAKLLG